MPPPSALRRGPYPMPVCRPAAARSAGGRPHLLFRARHRLPRGAGVHARHQQAVQVRDAAPRGGPAVRVGLTRCAARPGRLLAASWMVCAASGLLALRAVLVVPAVPAVWAWKSCAAISSRAWRGCWRARGCRASSWAPAGVSPSPTLPQTAAQTLCSHHLHSSHCATPLPRLPTGCRLCLLPRRLCCLAP
jgi:hypothetical protein